MRIETSAEVWAVIMARHRDDLKVFSSYSNPDGRCELGSGKPEMMTEYGLSGADFPIMRAETTWEKHPEKDYERVNEKHRYWLIIPINEETDQ